MKQTPKKGIHKSKINQENLRASSKTALLKENKNSYPSKALQPMQVSCFLANFNMPLFAGVEIEIDLV